MKTRTYVLMGRDECGDDFRAHGSEYLERTFEFPDWEEDDSMYWAYLCWSMDVVDKAQKEWNELYGPECRLFLEETYASQFRGMYGCFL